LYWVELLIGQHRAKRKEVFISHHVISMLGVADRDDTEECPCRHTGFDENMRDRISVCPQVTC
jgi:ferredoxin-thioredoxin reductase catalytic subunit